MQREIIELARALYQACSSRLYRVLTKTGAATRFADNITQRDSITTKMPGDRVLVTDAPDDPRIEEGSALYIQLPMKGLQLVWQSASQLDIPALAGAGLMLDADGKLRVNWRQMPQDALSDRLAAMLDDSLSLAAGKLSVNFWQMPRECFSLSLAALLSSDFENRNGVYHLRKLRAADLPLAELAGNGLMSSASRLMLNLSEIDLAELTAEQKTRLAAMLAGNGLYASEGRLELDIAGMGAVSRKAGFGCMAGPGLAINDAGQFCADYTLLPETGILAIFRNFLKPQAPLMLEENGNLAISLSSSLELPSESTAASSAAVYELAKRVREAEHQANLNQLRIFGVERNLESHIEIFEGKSAELDILYAAGAARTASQTKNGLMSAQDKKRLDDLAASGKPDLSGYATISAMNAALQACASRLRDRIAAATGKGAAAFALSAAPALLSLNAKNDACAWYPSSIMPYMREAAIKAVKERAANEIYYGFLYIIGGELYHFTYDINDQQNLADCAILANMNEPSVIFARDMEGRLVRLELAPEDAKALFKFAANRKTCVMEEARLERTQINAFTNYPELEYYLEEIGVLAGYEAILSQLLGDADPPAPEERADATA